VLLLVALVGVLAGCGAPTVTPRPGAPVVVPTTAPPTRSDLDTWLDG
jgi:hypothetical protein